MSPRTLLATVALAVGLAPALAGCGSDGGSASEVPTVTTLPSASADESPADEPTPSTSGATESSTATSTAPTTPTTTAPPTTGTTTDAPASPTGTRTAQPEQGTGPTTYVEAVARIERVAVSAAPVSAPRFATPRDLVYCLLDDAVIGPSCELRTGFVEEESYCGGGATNGVGRIETLDGRAQPVCNTDTIREPGARVARPGTVVESGSARCAVEQAGVTCVDTGARTGFFLTPGEYQVF
ncbi:hypothetical protein [Nocardioides sp. TF02-7]|uniref:hypothetical protein n=1 Tax=Nocardioides sp. TF02-7 TaxID=2917724 RepID=UPI001F0653E9|nr:hypothetical protein [Nocardioides sp. TF02-7]UMG92287.1 hypothetical protein MF408_20650 [Nocardioides sp. TF02-7]